MNAISELQQWYLSNCNGDWEHSYGIKIETLDNPGWKVGIELQETNLQNRSFVSIEIENNDDDWYNCQVKNYSFEAYGDPHKLNKLIEIFLDWAKSQNPDWLAPPTSGDLRSQADRDFYNLLNNSPRTLEICHRDDCDNFRLEHSVMCASHHFEMRRNYPFPDTIPANKTYEIENYWD
jgi:Immunity protein 53